ncbi:hypothetical protein HGRIS_013677 [Hohenbuehelia grisea]|uniref:MYND-type domain-containing protein n=1 Tax=Hohenbuehelia grisea TaxID=104357 RepID=A0ABR3IWB9_9AGAR
MPSGRVSSSFACEQRSRTIRCWSIFTQSLAMEISDHASYFSVARALRSAISFLKKKHPEELVDARQSSFWRIVALSNDFVTLVKGCRRRCSAVGCLNYEKPGSHYRRCASCWAVFYCSKQCQRRDWRLGGHRKACKEYHMKRQVQELNFDDQRLALLMKFVRYSLRTPALLTRLRELCDNRINDLLLVFTVRYPVAWDFVVQRNDACAGEMTIVVMLPSRPDKKCRRFMFCAAARMKWTEHLDPLERLTKEIETARGPRITYHGEDLYHGEDPGMAWQNSSEP